jgi:hypothetical protein
VLQWLFDHAGETQSSFGVDSACEQAARKGHVHVLDEWASETQPADCLVRDIFRGLIFGAVYEQNIFVPCSGYVSVDAHGMATFFIGQKRKASHRDVLAAMGCLDKKAVQKDSREANHTNATYKK